MDRCQCNALLLALSGLIGLTILWIQNRHGQMRTRYVSSLQNAVFFAIAAIGMIALLIPLAYGLWAAFPALKAAPAK